MIYTCYEMVRDCRADKPEGWSYFIAQYVPAIRKLLAHYGGTADLDRVLLALKKPESSLFASLDPAPERWFLAELRQKVLAELPARDTEIAIALETVADAFQPLTLTEKQAAWLETMLYTADQAGAMLRMSPKTVDKIRDRAAELIRAKVDVWRRSLLADNGPALGRAAAAASTKDCLPSKAFLDVLDGRTTWRGREEMEQHVLGCFHCIDHFCRMVEVIELLRGLAPLSAEEAEPFRRLLGVQTKKAGGWKRLFSGA
ncbi:MAG TPA: hypothetical protein VGF59_04695 [Bryobacteraceae bacterium]|jgi:hypothetical protein